MVGISKDGSSETIARAKNIPLEAVTRTIAEARLSLEPVSKKITVTEDGRKRELNVTRVGFGLLNTDFGQFYQFDFVIDDQWGKYSVLVRADLNSKFNPVFRENAPLLIRIDSGCETGQLFGDRTCECREQLELAMEDVKNAKEGMIVHIPKQDARGLGLPFKLATLTLEDRLKIDTVEAAEILTNGGAIDTRTYSGTIAILKFFEVPEQTKINLATNNPRKAGVFGENGYQISTFVPVVIPPTELTQIHLGAKQEKMGHIGLVRKEGPDQVTRDFMQLLDAAVTSSKSLVCCGLDPDMSKMPKEITEGTASNEDKAFNFLRAVVDITASHVCAYKLQKAFFDAFDDGPKLLAKTVQYIKTKYPLIPIILDSKIGDIDNTMDVYLKTTFGKIGVDAVVVNPYMGDDVLLPFRNSSDKAAVVLVKTSNPGASAVQDIVASDGSPMWLHVLEMVTKRWNISQNLIPVIPTTANLDFRAIRKIVPDEMPIFLAGFGAQGGQLTSVDQLLNSHRRGIIINSSRGILYPYQRDDPDWRGSIEKSVTDLKAYINSLRVRDGH